MQNKYLKSLLEKFDRPLHLSPRQVVLFIILLLVIGGGLRYGYWKMCYRNAKDEQKYIKIVERLNHGKDIKRTRLMSVIAHLVCYQCSSSPEKTLRVLNFLYSLAWLLVIFYLCQDIFADRKMGLVGMAFATCNPYSIRMSCQILREPLYMLIFTTALWVSVKLIKSNRYTLYPIFLGAFVVLGGYTRYEGIEIFIFLPLACGIAYFKLKHPLRVLAYSLICYFLSLILFYSILINYDKSFLEQYERKAVGYYKVLTGGHLL